MFFDALGRLLLRAGEVLSTDVLDEVHDDFVRRQVTAIAVLVGEVGAAWPELFAALERENGQLALALAAAGGEAADHAAVATGPADPPDPLARNAALLAAIDVAIADLHDRRDDGALRAVRGHLAAAAETEQDLLRRARDRAPTGSLARR